MVDEKNAPPHSNISGRATDITIGLANSTRPTLISGNSGNGVVLHLVHHVMIVNTSIGITNPNLGRLPLGNGGDGILVDHGRNNLINGTAAGDDNTIAYNGLNGVAVIAGRRNGIFHNSIYGNTLLGIDLESRANRNQSAPVMSSVITTMNAIKVSGILVSRPNTTYAVELFASKVNSDGGGKYLGSITVKTNHKGIASFVYVGALPPFGFDQITATATDPHNNTSEFSSPSANWANAH